MENFSLNFRVANSSITDHSVAFIWDKKEGRQQFSYVLYQDGVPIQTLDCTDATVEDLESETIYHFFLEAKEISSDLHESAQKASPKHMFVSEEIQVATKPQAQSFNIIEYGATNGKLSTSAIQAAIDACTPGGKVTIPSGCFITGALFLKSDMTLYLEEGARLLGSDSLSDYPLIKYRWEGREQLCYASLINTRKCDDNERLQNITIEGKGTIDGSGRILKPKEMEANEGCRGRVICIRNTDYVYLKDITVRNSPAWCVHPIYCTNVTLNRVHIYTKKDENNIDYEVINGDGFDPDSCQHVNVFHCMIASQDDCIAIKSGRDEEGRLVGIPTLDVRITNCSFYGGFGVAVGSEMSGGIKNVLVQDCDFHDSFSIGSVKAPRGRGAFIENVIYDHCTLKNTDTLHQDCKWFRGAIYIDNFYSHENIDPITKENVNESTPCIRNITFQDISLETVGGNAIFLAGLPEMPLQNINLIRINAVGKEAMRVFNVSNLYIEDINVQKY